MYDEETPEQTARHTELSSQPALSAAEQWELNDLSRARHERTLGAAPEGTILPAGEKMVADYVVADDGTKTLIGWHKEPA